MAFLYLQVISEKPLALLCVGHRMILAQDMTQDNKDHKK